MITRNTVVITIATLVQLLLGFTLQVVGASQFGFGKELDLHLIITGIGFIFILIVDSGVMYGVTSSFTFLHKNLQHKKLFIIANSLFNFLAIVIVSMLFIIGFFVPWLVEIITHKKINGLIEHNVVLQIYFYYSLGVLFAVISLVGMSLNYSRGKFIRASMASVFDLIVQLVVVIFFSGHIGVVCLSVGFCIGQFAKGIVLLFSYRSQYRLIIKKIAVKKIIKNNILPLSVSSAYANTSSVVDKYYASALTVGNVSLLQYSSYLASAVASILSKGLGIISLNEITARPFNEQKVIIKKNIKVATVLFTIYLILFWNFGEVVLWYLFSLSKKIDLHDIRSLFELVLILSGQIYTGMIASILNNIFYTNNKIRTVAIVSIASQTINLLLKIFFFSNYGVWGLAVNTSVNYCISLAMLTYFYKKLSEEKLNYEM